MKKSSLFVIKLEITNQDYGEKRMHRLEDYFETYQDEIELIQAQNRVECDLYSIIAYIIRDGKQGEDISLRDVSVRRETDFSRPFKGESGFPDFVIRTRDKNNNAKVLGAIEVKYVTEDLDLEKNLEQLNGHIISYKRVIYTNGLKWRFYYEGNFKNKWEIVLGEISGNTIIWKDNCQWKSLLHELDNIEWVKL